MAPQSPNESVDYSQTLRVIGQVLESFKAESFDIVCHGDAYLVRCLTKHRNRGLSKLLRRWKEQHLPRGGFGAKPFMNVELLYSLNDIKGLDAQGKAKRRDPHGMPDPFGLSSILRAAGEFVNRKGRLLLGSSRDQHVLVLYETPEGVRKMEEYQQSWFYDFCVGMYLKRKEKLSDPTV
ncbi:MAG TPA: hypothetical protein VFU31_13585 [Candidatus Binatia bacterium]|nr:hypothetical protein [Candidatus Binatia bacterium]